MATILEKIDRKVIPNFRSLIKSEKYGDLEFSAKDKEIPDLNNIFFEQQKEQWKKLKTIGHAADLVSSGIVINLKDPVIIDAAKYIVKSNKSSKSLDSAVEKILTPESNIISDLNYLKLFISKHRFKSIYNQIGLLKLKINSFPNNPLNYVELSRFYLILGQKEKAIQSIQKALFLDSDNRFILRAAVRLYFQYNEYDKPHYYLLNSKFLLNDPWLISAEIALSSLRNKNSRLIKKGLHLINSNNFSPFSLTELYSSIGTIELMNGKIRKAKKLFLKSLECPNDNSLAQVEWASKKELLFDLNIENYRTIDKKCEALTLMSFHNEDWKEAIHNAEQWFIESPFSKRPLLLSSHVSSVFLNNQKMAIEFSRAGLISHPRDPQLINNLVYSLALLNKIPEAEKFMNQVNINKVDNIKSKICLTATQGLIFYRKGNVEQGRKYYLEAIQNAKHISQISLYYTAILNFAREEILSGSKQIDDVMNLVIKIPDGLLDKSINILKDNVIKKFKKFQNSKKYKRIKKQ